MNASLTDVLYELLKFTTPSIVTGIIVLLVLRYMIKIMIEREIPYLKIERMKVVLPIRLRAYERLMLYLERISPENLGLRIMKEARDAGTAHRLAIKSIQEEFEHNQSQRLYVSMEIWKMVKGARDFMLKVVNEAMAKVTPEAPAVAFFNSLWEQYNSEEKNVHLRAIELLHEEVKELFR